MELSDNDILACISEHTTEIKRGLWLRQIRYNEEHYGFKGVSLRELSDRYGGRKAVVLAAGPGFKRFGMGDLKEVLASEPVVISCDGALPTLASIGYRPDLVISVDAHPVVANFYRRSRKVLEGATVLLSTTINRDVVEECLSAGAEIGWIQGFFKGDGLHEKFHREGVTSVNSGGNVGTTSYVLAAFALGCRPIGLMGLEFAWSDETPYNESVAGYSPVMVKGPRGVMLTSIGDFWTRMSPTITDKMGTQFADTAGWSVASEHGHWTPIIHASRHWYEGELVRVNATTGLVDVTPNHSLYTRHPTQEDIGAKNLLKDARDVVPGDRVYSPFLSLSRRYKGKTEMDLHLAWLYGIFAAEGSAPNFARRPVGVQQPKIVTIWNNNRELLQECHNIIEESFPVNASIGFRGGEHPEQGWVTANSTHLWTTFRNMFYTSEGLKRVPSQVLEATTEAKKAFVSGYLAGDGHETEQNISFSSNSQPLACGLLYLIRGCYPELTYVVHSRANITDCLVNKSANRHRRKAWEVWKTERIPYRGWVYDVETKDHSFLSGVGLIKVHNTQYYDQLRRIVGEKNVPDYFRRVENRRDGRTYIADPVYYSYMLMFREIWADLPADIRRATVNLTMQGILSAPGLKYMPAKAFAAL